MSREAWLARRREGIGASDAASVCGIEGAFGTPLSVWLDKMGRLPPFENRQMRWGLKLEEVVAAAYQEETGNQLLDTRLAEGIEMCWHPEIPWMFATIDRIATGPDGRKRVVQLKTASAFDSKSWGEPGTDEVPQVYLVQVQQEMACTGAEIADIPVLFGASDFRVYTVERNEQLIRDLVTIGGDFWGMVQRREPPEPDWTHPQTPKLLEHLHRPDPAKTASLGDEIQFLWECYEDGSGKIGALKAQQDQIKARIVEAMGDAGIGLLPDGRQLCRKEVNVKERVARAYSYFNLTCRKARTK